MVNYGLKNTCCFVGHRTIENKPFIYEQVKQCVTDLINRENITTFLFGSKSQFDELCLEVVTELKNIFPNIKRVYVRAVYDYVTVDYEKYLLTLYDDTFYAEKARNANRLAYVKRNEEMIDKSSICIFHYKYNAPHSGTAIAFKYAQQLNKRIIKV